MKLSMYRSFGFLVVALGVLVLQARNGQHQDVVKFVKGGACAPGDGSKKHPFISLEQAQQDTSWKTLLVLSSTIPLEGTITLENGKCLIGEENPTCGSVSPTQPTITNPSGTAVVVKGNATIKNLYFKDIETGIDYQDAQDLILENLLFSGFTEGLIGGDRSGTTYASHLIMRNNNSGNAAILDVTNFGSKRELHICNSQFFDLTVPAISVISTDPDSSTHVTIEKSTMHDIHNESCLFLVKDDAALQAKVEQVSCFNGYTNFIKFRAEFTDNAELQVNCCTFEDLSNQVTAVRIENLHASSSSSIKNSQASLKEGFVLSTLLVEDENTSPSTQEIRICNNYVRTNNFFYLAANEDDNNNAVTHVDITHNAVFVDQGNGIFVNPSQPWKCLAIKVKDNCFTGKILGESKETIAFAASGSCAGNDAILTAHHNSIVHFNTDIKDVGAKLTYIVCRNWWGQGVECDDSKPCGQYQECRDNICLGPQNITVGAGVMVDASKPLSRSIKCPYGCCPQPVVPAPLAQPTV